MNNLPVEHYVVAALCGLLLGVLVTWLAMRNNKTKRQEHEQLVREFGDYRARVDRHFVDTAEAVDELNRSYQKVVQHLSTGAQSLMGKEALEEQLNLRGNKAVTVAYLAYAAQSAPLSKEEAVSDTVETVVVAEQPVPDAVVPVEAPIEASLDPVEQEPVSEVPVTDAPPTADVPEKETPKL
ncbi:ZapG family protein [Neisseria wadsworthii]|uniref:ZapG family protein n=1 Tax=Neisseria wadsworthii TaxID=607711 RepID=UPI000D2FC39E|nr:DUF1043 family protein [Neisseria wadsworthii]